MNVNYNQNLYKKFKSLYIMFKIYIVIKKKYSINFIKNTLIPYFYYILIFKLKKNGIIQQ